MTSMPGMPPVGAMPSVDDMMRQMNEARGHGEAPAEAVDEEGVQVVFQTGHTSAVSAVALSADGRHIVSGGQDEQTRIWDVASGQETRAIAGAGFGWPRNVGFNADASRFYVEGFDRTVFYDRRQDKKAGESRTPHVSKNGRIRADIQETRGTTTPVLIDTASGAVIWSAPGSGLFSIAALSGDGDSVLVREMKVDGASISISLRLWRVSTRKSVDLLELNDQQVLMLAVSQHGRWVAMEDIRGTVVLVDGASGKVARRIPSTGPMLSMVNTLMFSPDESQLAHATAAGEAKIWDVSDGSVVLSLEASALNFSDDAKTLVLGGARGGAPWLRDVVTGAETRLSAAAAQISDLAIADRGSTLIAASTDGMAKQWDMATGELTRAFSCAAGTAAWSVAASESAPLLAIGCMDGSVSIWNRTTGERVAQPMRAAGSGYAVTRVTFARGGQLLVAGSRKEIIVWDVATSTVRRRIELPPAAVPAYVAETPPGARRAKRSQLPRWRHRSSCVPSLWIALANSSPWAEPTM